MARRNLCMICLPLLLWLVFMGITGGGMPIETSRPWPPGSYVEVEGTVCRQECKGTNQVIYLKNISILSEASQNSEAASEYTKKNLMAYLKDKQSIEIGNMVRLLGVCAYPAAPENPGGFDAHSYYSAMNIGMIVKKASVEQKSSHTDVFAQLLAGIREKASDSLFCILNKEEAGVLAAMLLGEKSGLAKETKELYQDSGIIHILAISGLHISLLGMGLYRLLRKMRLSFAGAGAAAGSVMVLYGIMTGMSFSAVRAVIMFLIFLGAQITGRTYDSVTALVSAASVMLLHNCKMVTQAGFLLSFAAVAGVNMALYSSWMPPRWESLRISAGIWLVTLPLTAWFYYRVPVYGIFLNLLVIPMMPLVAGFGAAGMAAGLFSRETGVFLAAPVHYLLSFITFLCSKICLLPGSTWVVGRPNHIQIVIYYLFLLIFLLFFKKKRKIDLITRAFGIILMICTVLYREPQQWTMTFLNVGQGDGCCIQTEGRSVWMIDGGSSDRQNLAAYSLQPYLEYHGISGVDYWMVSHYDSDHVSGLIEILEEYEKNFLGENAGGITVRHIILPDAVLGEGAAAKEVLHEKILELAKKNGIPVRYTGAGDVICQGDTCFRVLGPRKGGIYESGNEASMVVEVSYKGFKALLTGDVEGKGERELLEAGYLEDVDVLKAAHHGSGNSTSELFLEQAAPEAAVISCGKDNSYGHPHEELLERLNAEGIRIVRTDEKGAVDVTVTEDGYRIACAD